MDLTSFASVKAAADTFNSKSDRLDVLMNNAGIMACPSGITKEGYEIQFGTNHMGHALLTKLLLPTLQRTAAQSPKPGDVRIVNLSSEAHKWAPKAGLTLNDCKSKMESYSTWQRYGQSKLANIYYTRELARRYPDITCVSLHPGSVATNLTSGPRASYPWASWIIHRMSKLVAVSVQVGALGQLWASTAPAEQVKSGQYYVPVAKESMGSELARDEKLPGELWDWTERELRKHGYE